MIAAWTSIAQPSRVRAQARPVGQEPVRVQLTLEADARCATQAMLAEQVHARSQRIAFVDASDEVPRIRVAIGGAAAGDRVAELTVQWPDGQRSERRLTAGSCASAVEALALLLAMTLDPAAFDDTAATDSAAPATPKVSAEAEAPPPNPPASSSARTTASTHAPHPLGVAQLAVGARAQLASGPTPRAMPGLGAYARLAMNGAGWWAPALQLQLAYGWAHGLSEAGGDADFTLESAALDVCPLGLQRPPLWAHACFASAVGRLTASGSDTYTPRTEHRLWSSLGGRLLLTLDLGSWAELQGGFGLAAPLRRYRFAFSPEVFHRVPSVCLEGHLGAGVRFP